MSAWRDAVGMERERVVARIKTAQAEMDAFLATPEA